jgi:hypothetical protein
MRRRLFPIRVLLAVVVLIASIPEGVPAADESPREMQQFDQIALEVEQRIASAEEQLLLGVSAVEALLKSSKTEAGDMTGAWNSIVEQNFLSPPVRQLRILLPRLELALQREAVKRVSPPSGARPPGGGRITPAIAVDIRNDAKELLEFVQEIQSVGEAVAWTLKVNRHIKSLEFDIENAPLRVDVYVKEMRETSSALVNILARIRRGMELRANRSATPAALATLRNEVAQSIRNVMVMKNKTLNASLSLVNTTKYLEPGEGYVVPEAEAKRIAVLAEYWKNSKDLYPLVRREILEGVGRWAPLPKAKWEAYGETRKKFVEVYGPLLAGDIFKGLPLFDGKKYSELPGVVLEVENALRTLLAGIDDVQRDLDERRKALDQDEILTQRERAQLMMLVQRYSPERAKILALAVQRAGGGSNRILELERLKKSVAAGSEEYRKYDDEQRLLKNRQHPEQVKADDAMKDFVKGLEDARRAAQEILKSHEARRKALGLSPAFKEPALAKRN